MGAIFQKFNIPYLIFGLFALLIAAFYGSSLQNGFIYDDNLVIRDNIYIQSLSYFPKVITGCMWEYTFGQCEGRSLYYRPMQSLSYLLTWQISSQPWVFHLVNLLYFFAVVSLIFLVARALTNNLLLGFIASLLVLVHPAHSEVVNWIAAAPELLTAIFVLGALLSYIKYRQSLANQDESGDRSPPWSFLLNSKRSKLILVYVFYFLALSSKESALLMPALFVFVDWTFFRKTLKELFEWAQIKIYLGFLLPLAIYMVLRVAVLGGGFIQQGVTPHGEFSIPERMYAFFTLFSQYIIKLLYPDSLLFFYHFEKKSALLSLEFFVALIVAALFAAAAILALKKTRALLVFFLLWIILFLLPVLLFLNSLGESVFAERYLFLPGIGFAFALSYVFSYVWQRSGRTIQISLAAVLSIVVVTSFIIIWQRNSDWKDNETMYTKTLIQNPKAYPIRFNWAVFLRREVGDFEAAKTEFETLLAQNPDWTDIGMVYLHLGDYYRDEKEDIVRALEYYEKSGTAEANVWKAHFAYDRIGGILASQEQYLRAIPYFCQAVQIYPEAEGSQGRLNTALSLIPVQYEDRFLELHEETKQVFVRSEHERIRFTRMFCEGETCSYIFSVQFEEPEIILSNLITAATGQGEVAGIQGSAFNPPTSEAMVRIDSSFEDTSLSFIFPTCEGVYYEAVSAVEQ